MRVPSNAFRALETLARMSFADAVTPRTQAFSGIYGQMKGFGATLWFSM